MSVGRVIKTCKDCNKPFSISAKKLTWLEEHGLKPFERCSACLQKRREQRGKQK